MALKKSSLVLLLLFCLNGFSQQSANKPKGTSNTKNVQNSSAKKLGTAQINNMVLNLKHDTCLDKKFSIVFYFIQNNMMTLGPATYSLPNGVQSIRDSIIFRLNKVFKPICVSFVNCTTVVIPNHPFNDWTKNGIDTIVTSNWYTEKTINLYLPETVLGAPGSHPTNYAYPPPPNNQTPAKDVIVVEKASISTTNTSRFIGDDLIHAFGHFFGLPHTFDEINPNLAATPPPPPGVLSKEYYDRSNCYLHGDGFCDTDADPWPTGSTQGSPPFCFYGSGIKDGKGDFYLAPSENFMSASSCRCKFSQEQYNYMAYIILTRRLYLH